MRYFAIDQSLQGLAVRRQSTKKSRNRGQEALLQTDEAEFRQRRLLCRQRGDAALAQLPVGSEAAPQVELGCIIRQAGDPDGFDLALRKRFAETAERRRLLSCPAMGRTVLLHP